MKDSPENPKIEKNSEIDLMNVKIEFWSDEQIAAFFDDRLEALNDPENFLSKNQWQLDNLKRHVAKEGYSDQEIADKFIQREKRRSVEMKEKCIAVKAELESKLELIMEAVHTKLATYLPNWKPSSVKVTFKIMEDADYRHPNNGEVEADLWRIVYKENKVDDVIHGVTHEIFHEWMNEQGELKRLDEYRKEDAESAPLEIGRKLVRARTIDEGLAVLISGQSLKQHHEERGIDYGSFVMESFKYFDDFEKITDAKEQKSVGSAGFKNMGQFYVVGYEIVRAVRDHVGEPRFKELVALARENPELMFEEDENI
jgi:hypothetical protein